MSTSRVMAINHHDRDVLLVTQSAENLSAHSHLNTPSIVGVIVALLQNGISTVSG